MTTTPTLWLAGQQANTTDSGTGGNDQTIPQIVSLANGTFVVLWESNTNTGAGADTGTDIVGQRYDAEGKKLGAEFLANNGLSDKDEGDFAAAALPNGNFVVAYEATDANGTSILYTLLTSTGGLVRSGTIQIDSGVDDLGAPSIAVNPDNSFQVFYQRSNLPFGGTETDRITVASNGSVGAEADVILSANSTDVGAGGQQVASAVLTNASTVVVSRSNGSDPGLKMHITASSGQVVLNTTSVEETKANGDTDLAPAVAALSGGGFVVAWENTDASDTDIEFQLFNAAGAKVGPLRTVNSSATDKNFAPKMVGLPDGGFVMVYDDNEASKIALQRYDSTGVEVGDEVTVATGTGLGGVSQPTVTLADDGRLLVGWTNSVRRIIPPADTDNDVRFAVFDPREKIINGDNTANTITSRLDGATVNGLGGSDTLLGQGEADTLNGGDGADTIRGRGGNDVIQGGLNSDTIFGDEGNDTIFANLQDAPDLSTNGDTISGGVGDDTIRGSNGTDTIDGGADNDTINGGGGADAMTGGAGNDRFTVDNVGDTVTEAAGGGVLDVVFSSVSFSLAGQELEALVLTGGDNVDATGNALVNSIGGNTGANRLDGGEGADEMVGKQGNDTYVVDNAGDAITELAGEGSDTVNASVSFALAAVALGGEVETVNLTGTGDIDATGNEIANALNGNAGANRLDGGAGADALAGGAGNDTYVVDDAGDTVTELAGGGSDTVQSSTSFTLAGQELEALVLTGAAAISGTGNALVNALAGNGANNALDGGANNDTIDGGAGADAMTGGTGDDSFVVDDAGDTVIEANGEGTDTVRSSASFSLATGFAENLILTGAGNVDATGNALANALTGNSGNNVLDGGTNADSMAGGAGDDTYAVENAGDAVTELAGEGTDTIVADFSFSLAGLEVENLALTGTVADATGNAKANVLTGNDAANRLDGQSGADTMSGGKGNDTYLVDDKSDKVVEAKNSGLDTVLAGVSFSLAGSFTETLTLTGTAANDATGNSLANKLNGNGSKNKLDGGAGADTMTGGAGDDTYVVDNKGDKVVEVKNGGADTVLAGVSFSLSGTVVETLTLTGTAANNATGNSLANKLNGNAGKNRLDGQGGADTMSGGKGDDTYAVDNKGDKVVEAKNSGLDTALSSVSFSLGGSFVENLSLTGTGANSATGNSLANKLSGNGAKNKLDGGIGADTMTGGKGDDTYVVDNKGDKVVEADKGGADTVLAGVSLSLKGTAVETLTLTGKAANNATGNSLANTLNGNAGKNTLAGGAGNDKLKGNGGADTFLFDTALDGKKNVDALADFKVDDTMKLENAVFAGLKAGALAGSAFKDLADGSKDKSDRILYDSKSGDLFFDRDGSDAKFAAVRFAHLDNKSDLAAGDFLVV